MELSDYLSIVRRRWLSIIAVLVIVFAAVAAWTFAATPTYASTSRLFVSTTDSSADSAYTGNLFATQRVTSYADLIDSRELAGRVADRLEEPPTDEALVEQVSATVVPETVVLEITATTTDAEFSQRVAQAYADELRLFVEELEAPTGRGQASIKATIVDDASLETSAVSPQPLRNFALAAVLGLLLGVGLAVARELLDTSVSSADDVAEVTQAPILGTIPRDLAANRDPGEEMSQPSQWSEAFRVLRTNMQYVEVDHESSSIVLTSSLPGEGKTTVAINLAVAMAQTGRRVALVEADLRRPLVARRLGLDGAVGTTSVLIGRISLQEALQPLGDTGLQVLACGPIPPNPAELLQSHAMRELLAQLRQDFDVVVLDGPPLLPVTDSSLLAAQTDGAVVVVRDGVTTKDQLDHAVERVSAVDGRLVGVIINQSASRASTGYGYGYGYGVDGGSSSKREKREAAAAARAERASTSRGARRKR